jgi:SPX domain protein involved in polyphosphate accumulation
LRWYHSEDVAQLQLELKIKSNRQGKKITQDLGEIDLKQFTVGELVESIKDSNADMAFRNNVRLTSPVLQNSYSRQYFISGDESFRATIDTDQVFCSKGNNDILKMTKMTIPYPYIIIEFKSDLLSSESTTILNGFPLTATRSSKYIAGVSRLKGIPYF